MRPLYVYYKKLKIAITQKEKEEGNTLNGPNTASIASLNANSINVSLNKNEEREINLNNQNNNNNINKNKVEPISAQPNKEESLSKGFKLNLSKLGVTDNLNNNDKRANALKVENEQRLSALMNRKSVLRNVLQQ